jgi:hypothetical protein
MKKTQRTDAHAKFRCIVTRGNTEGVTVSTVQLTDEEDEMVWQFTSKGIYSSQSLYKVISFRGIKQVHVPSVWNIKIPPRVHIFLWLLINNRVLTRDNLAKRRKLEDESCLLCSEKKTSQHL